MRKMIRIALITLAMLTAYASLPAQTVTVSATKLGGLTPITGTISWQPTTNTGQPASFQVPSGGQQVTTPITAYVTAGVFTLTLPDVSLTSPQNICYSVTATVKGKSVLGLGYSCVQPHGTATGESDWCQAGVCNFDNYVPNLPAIPTLYQAPDVITALNTLVAQLIAGGTPPSPQKLTDAASVTMATGGAALSEATLQLTSAYSTRTLNIAGLAVGSKFVIVINTPTTSQAAPQAVMFGTGCTWQFMPSPVNVSPSTGLIIPQWANWSYLIYGVYDGTNCIATVAD
jgi:hypothetical protein